MSAALAALFSFLVAGCGGSGCSALEPLPSGVRVPADQTIEGGVQVRVTKSGFDKIEAMIPGLVASIFGDIYVPPDCSGISNCQNPGGDCLYWRYCYNGAGCKVNFNIDSINTSIPDPSTFRIDAQFDIDVPQIPVNGEVACIGASCQLSASLANARIEADVRFSIDPATGELRVNLAGIRSLDLSGFSLTGCSGVGDFIGDVIGALLDFLSTDLGNLLVNLLTPLLDDFVQDLLPKPLGIEGLLPIGSMVSSISPGNEATMEARAVAGGYVSLPKEGLSVGVIVGLNADRDLNTRDRDRDSEPALCVPQRPAPDFAAAPHLLPKVARSAIPFGQTFLLQPADAFLGEPSDPAADVALGLSETVMDLAGHHVVSSGGMCLAVGTSTIEMLNVGTIGLIAPSLSQLGDGSGTGKEPVLLVLRPQHPLDFSIGEETMTDPRIGVALNEMEIDFYVWAYERYTRVFTISLTMNVGINVDFTMTPEGKPAIQPVILGLDTSTITVKVENAEILKEDPADLEALFPTLLDLVIPLLGNTLGAFELPEIAGFRLENLQDTKIVTSQDEFLGIYATMAAASAKTRARLDKSRPFLPEGFAVPRATEWREVETHAQVVRVTTPPPARIRNALLARDTDGLPEVELAIGGRYADGGLVPGGIEWQWSLDGGMWRPFSRDLRPVLRDRAFAVQGRHTLRIRARQIGDYRTFDRTPVELPLVIDSAPPHIFIEKATREGDDVVLVARDLVTEEKDLVWTVASTDGGEAVSLGRVAGRIPAALLGRLASEGLVELRVADELGNTATAVVDLRDLNVGFHGRAPADAGGCSCHVGDGRAHSHGEGGLGAALLGVLFALAAGLGRRTLPLVWGLGRRTLPLLRRAGRRVPLLPMGLILAMGLAPGCSCSDASGLSACEVHEDCAAMCTGPTAPLCLEGMCFCADDIPLGQIGTHSDVGVGPSGIAFVSAYNQEHGDLMVAEVMGPGRVPDENWEFVDGVPDGPVAIPTSKVRGGIAERGDDVGLYTSIAVNAQGEPLVSYFDRTTSSLRFAGRFGGTWRTMIVDRGASITPEIGGEEAGKYTSISVTSADGRPGIAYYATVYEGNVGRTEVRYARAKIPQPSSEADWEVFVVDQAPIPPLPDGASPPADLPEGVGLFVSQGRLPDGSPVLAYYDRPNGDLKLAWFDPNAQAFAPPIVVDGADGEDVGWYPAITSTADGALHLSYVDALRDNLLYVSVGADKQPGPPVVVDDGYRVEGMTSDGYSKPVFHLVGDDSAIVAHEAFLAIVYQDATSHELLLAKRNPNDLVWTRETIAGAEDPFRGAYGFYAAAEFDGQNIVISTFANDLKNNDFWVEIFYAPIFVE